MAYKCYNFLRGTNVVRIVSHTRLLRDSHLDLEIETLKVNSRLILNLDSQFFHKNSHSHSRLSISSSQKYESQEI